MKKRVIKVCLIITALFICSVMFGQDLDKQLGQNWQEYNGDYYLSSANDRYILILHKQKVGDRTVYVTEVKGNLPRLNKLSYYADIKVDGRLYKGENYGNYFSVNKDNSIYSCFPGVYHLIIGSKNIELILIDEDKSTNIKFNAGNIKINKA